MKKVIIFLIFCSAALSAQTKSPKYEFRSAWVATVANIDWPRDKNASSGEQIKELVEIFDKLEEAGMNAVIFQVRTECDALYDSNIEPWSYWLTGVQGKAPEPYFDPLKFAIDEAHKRGMELHAWLNPYRSVKTIDAYEQSENHVSKTHPEWLIKSKKYLMLNPGIPAVKKYVLSVVSDIVTRYDVDGIHFDDYFYPYTPMQGQDSLTFAKYNNGIDNIDDWRRYSINDLMSSIYDIIKSVKPHIKFGISPFGIVENKYADTGGFESYNVLYCDPLNWLENKIVDYVNPQLYWEMDHSAAPYAKLLPWWAEVSKDRHLYIGLFSSKMASSNYKGRKTELGDQLRMNRNTENVDGMVYFSAKSITRNWSGLLDSCKQWFNYTALPPTMPWKDNIKPLPPVEVSIEKLENKVKLSWQTPEPAKDGDLPKYYLIYRFAEDEEMDFSDPSKIVERVNANKTEFVDNFVKNKDGVYTYVVSSLDRLFNESEDNQIKSVVIEN